MAKNEGKDSINRIEIILEHMQDDFTRFGEVLDSVDKRLVRVEKDVAELKENTADYPMVKTVVREHSMQIQDHDQRLKLVEKQVA